MKKVVVLSDSHNNLPIDDDFYKMLDEADLIIHLGDGQKDIQKLLSIYKEKFVFVPGNCDLLSQEDTKIIKIEDVSFLITHGHKYRVKSDLVELSFECNLNNIRYALYGHTHFQDATIEDGVTLINPGSIGYNREYCYLVIEKNKVVYNLVHR